MGILTRKPKTRLEGSADELRRAADVLTGWKWTGDGPLDPKALLRNAAHDIETLMAALRDARPYVYNAMCTARAEGQRWRQETAEPILEQIDALLQVPA